MLYGKYMILACIAWLLDLQSGWLDLRKQWSSTDSCKTSLAWSLDLMHSRCRCCVWLCNAVRQQASLRCFAHSSVDCPITGTVSTLDSGPQALHCTWLGPQLEVSGTVELWENTYSNWDPLRLVTLTQTLMAKGPFVPYGTASSSTMLSFACTARYNCQPATDF